MAQRTRLRKSSYASRLLDRRTMLKKFNPVDAVPKDKGWTWVCLLGSVMVNFLVVGCCIRSFGIFFHLIQERYNASAAEISWIPALVGFVAMMSAMPVNLICKRFGHRRVTVIGGVLMNVGFVLSTFATKLWMLYFTYGLLIGTGIGLSYVPSLVIVGTYFEKRRALANGVTFAAGSAGTFALPPMIKYLLDTYGLDGTFYILGGAVFHVSVAGMLFRPPEFYVPRYLMRQRLRGPGSPTTQMQDRVAYLPDDNNIEESGSGSVMCESCVRIEGKPITPAISIDSTLTCTGGQHTMYAMSTIAASEKYKNDDVAVSDSICVIDTSMPDGGSDSECGNSSTNGTTLSCDAASESGNVDAAIPVSDKITVYVIDTSKSDEGSDSECGNGSTNDTTLSCDARSESTEEDTYNWKVLKNPLLYVYVLTLSMSDSSFSNAFMMVPPHATDIGISKFKAVFLVSILGITDGISRLLTGLLADFNLVEKKHIYKASIGLCGLLFFVFPLVKQYLQLAVVCGFCGLVSGSFVVLAPVLLAEELGSANIPVTYGAMYSTVALFYLASPVVMSLLRDISGHWDISFFVTSSVVVFASMVNLLEPSASKSGHKKRVQD